MGNGPQELSGNVLKFERRTLDLQQPNSDSVNDYASPAIALAEYVYISDDASYKYANDSLGEVKQSIIELERQLKEITKPLSDVEKGLRDLFRGPIDGLRHAESIIKNKMRDYYLAQQLKAREEEQRLRMIAAKESERLEKAAARAASKDQTEKADSLLHQAQTVPVPVVAAPPPPAAGVSYRETWQFRVTNANAIPREYLVVDEKLIRRVVQAMKGNTNIPGVDVYSETILSKRI